MRAPGHSGLVTARPILYNQLIDTLLKRQRSMKTFRRVLTLVSVLTLAGSLAGSGNVSSRPREIRFEKGKTSTTLQGTLTAGGETAPLPSSDEYSLHSEAGQVMTIRFAGLDPGASFSVLCPHGGKLETGRSTSWSSV